MSNKSEIQSYNDALAESDKVICNFLCNAIIEQLPDAEYKIWHAHPFWFLDCNPIVGYHKLKDSVRLLFWSGQSFEEENLKPEGKFKAAEIRFTSVEQIDKSDVIRWLQKSRSFQWDYKNIVKRKGKLERLF